jgi:sarcosine oxidase
MTTNNIPRFHKLAPNVISVSGYNGRGIAPGTTFGREMAGYILGDHSDADLPLPLTAIKDLRLRGLREAVYEFGSQLVHLLSLK